ncbi:hypothetical protein I7I48_06777 [Histoplasma ohiense]|nr:hypothetical protein I7I48_06777 [Histoplasma ohiense (nom. inval.)]
MSGSWNALTASMKGLTPEKTTFITRTRIKLCKMAWSAVCRELNFITNHCANVVYHFYSMPTVFHTKSRMVSYIRYGIIWNLLQIMRDVFRSRCYQQYIINIFQSTDLYLSF